MRIFHIVWVIVVLSACQAQHKKINGMSLVASRDTLSEVQLRPLLATQTNFVSIMPFGFVRDITAPNIYFNTNRQWYGETVEGVAQYIEIAHSHGLQVMLKPQIWIMNGVYTGHMKMTTEADWQLLETTYRDFIMTFGKVAAENEVALFCIGTELQRFIEHRPEFWKELIAEVKLIYPGKLTYAANWDEYDSFPFWEELDYIGVDAYFPISEAKTPTLAQAKAGWAPWVKELKHVSRRHDTPVLFTEFGYRSRDFAGKEPWQSERTEKDVNMEAQVNLLQGLYESVWQEPWMHGGFLWKWFLAHDRVGGVENTMFTPQNKPAEKLLKDFYDIPEE